jgi:peroxiredoxin
MTFQAAPAPDFELADLHGHPLRLSDYHGQAHVLLVFLRGFL